MERKALEYFRVFFEATQAILSSESLGEVLKLLVKRAVRAVGAKAGSLRLLDEKTRHLEHVASHLLSRRYLEKGAVSSDRSIPAALEGRVVAVRDASTDPRVQYPEALLEEGIHGILSVPVVSREKVLGVLRLYTGEPRDFSAEEIEFLSALAEIGGLAIANARSYRDEGVRLSNLLAEVGVDLPREAPRGKQRFKTFAPREEEVGASLERFRVLHHVTRALLTAADSRQVTELITEKVLAATGATGCTLRLVNETTRELDLVAARGLSESFLQKGPVHADRSLHEALGGVPVWISEVATDSRVEYPAELTREGICSLLSLPILARERVIGVLRLYCTECRPYSREEIAFLSALAEIAGVAIMNAKLQEKTRHDLAFWAATLQYLDVQERTGE